MPVATDALTTRAKPFVLGIDIGGTKIEAALFPVINGKLGESIWKHSEPTLRAGDHSQEVVANHAQQVAKLISHAAANTIPLGGAIVSIGIGSPGRFDTEGKIKPKSNPMLGKSESDFDEVNLTARYRDALQLHGGPLPKLPIGLGNDASAMMAGTLETIRQSGAPLLRDAQGNKQGKTALAGKQVALFGIGTGVGHAIAKLDKHHRVERFITDGDAGSLVLPIDAEDRDFLLAAEKRLEAKTGSVEVLWFEDGAKVRAEDLFRGPMVAAMCGVNNGREIDLTNPQHQEALAFAGKYMARLALTIRTGKVEDVEPANCWTPAEQSEAAKTDIYLVGGGLGRSNAGMEIIRHAQAVVGDAVQFMQYSQGSEAVRAAASLAPATTVSRRVGR